MRRFMRISTHGAGSRRKDKILPKVDARSARSPDKPKTLLELQRLIGNQATQQILKGTTTIQRATGDGHDLTSRRFRGDPDLEDVYDHKKKLQSGSRGTAVEIIQKALMDAGFPLPKYGVDGVFGPETKSAVMMFQRTAGLKGADVDGVIGPVTMGLMDQRIGNTPDEWSRYLVEGLDKLAAGLPKSNFPGVTTWRYDSRFWKRVKDPVYYMAFAPKVKPADAVDLLFANLGLWDFDCAMFPEVALIYAERKALGAAKFNIKFNNLILRQHNSPGVERQFYDGDVVGKETLDRVWNSAPVGSKVTWSNLSPVTIGTAWQNENAIKRYKGATWQEDRYDAHPLGSNLSEQEVKKKLAENASDYPATGSEWQKQNYINKNIYRHGVRIILHP